MRLAPTERSDYQIIAQSDYQVGHLIDQVGPFRVMDQVACHARLEAVQDDLCHALRLVQALI